VERADTPVMFMRAEDTPEAITSAWAEFEELVGLKGRKFFGSFDPIAKEYRVSRPAIEFYRSREVIDLLLPVA